MLSAGRTRQQSTRAREASPTLELIAPWSGGCKPGRPAGASREERIKWRRTAIAIMDEALPAWTRIGSEKSPAREAGQPMRRATRTSGIRRKRPRRDVVAVLLRITMAMRRSITRRRRIITGRPLAITSQAIPPRRADMRMLRTVTRAPHRIRTTRRVITAEPSLPPGEGRLSSMPKRVVAVAKRGVPRARATAAGVTRAMNAALAGARGAAARPSMPRPGGGGARRARVRAEVTTMTATSALRTKRATTTRATAAAVARCSTPRRAAKVAKPVHAPVRGR
jgi:hypothetical protein